jgi:hypothetical protein
MEKQSTIAIMLGVSIALLVIVTSFLPLQQFASAQEKICPRPPANTAGSNMTGGANMTGPAANTTGGMAASPPPA